MSSLPIGKNLATKLSTSVKANDMLNYVGEPSPVSLCFEPVSEDVIQTVVMSLNSCSPCYDEVPTAVYKE